MKGLSPFAKEELARITDDLFDRMAIQLLGRLPQYKNKKLIGFSANPSNTLAHLFLKTLGQVRPLPNEEDVLKNLLSTAHDYIESLRHKTKATLTEGVDSYIKSARMKGQEIDGKEVRQRIVDSLNNAKTHFKLIGEAESTKARNFGKVANISRVGASMGESDPTVFFVVVKDGATCNECKRLHLRSDGITPKVWKLSELKFGYHKKGEDHPSACGLHPHCFVGDTKIHTKDGLIAIEDLFKSQLAPSVSVDNRILNRKLPANQYGVDIPGKVKFERHYSGSRFYQASKAYETGVQDCLEIELESGQTLKVSTGHEMWVDDDRNGKKVPANTLKIGDKLPLMSGESGFGEDSFEDLAELMGNLMGDGTIIKNYAMWNFFGNDIPYGETLLIKARAILQNKGCNPAFKKMSKTLRIYAPDKKYKVPRARFCSKILRDIFVTEFEVSKKPRRVPERLWTADKKTVAAFLRGLYAADGHSESNPSVVIAQNDFVFLKEIQLLLSNFGLISRIYDHGKDHKKEIVYANGDKFMTKRKKAWRLTLSGTSQVKRFYQEIGMGVSSKNSALKDRLEKTTNNEQTRFFWRTARIKSIKEIGKHQTYCLTEPMTNTVTANGIVTGNCRCSISYVAPGFGFKNGIYSYVSPDHDELKAQRGE